MLNWLKRKGSKDCTPAPSAGQQSADKALAREDVKLRKTDEQTDEIIAAARALHALGTQNDFAGRLRKAMGGAG